MEHLLPPQSPLTSHYDPWSPYHEHGIDYAGDSYIAAHHVNVEQGNYQNSHYGHIHHQSYAIAQNEVVQHAPLTPPNATMSYWPTAQAPTTASGPPLSMHPLDPMYYPQSCYENQNISLTEHRHAATEDHFQPDIARACAGTTYGTAGMIYPEQDTTLATTNHDTALPALAQHPTIAHNQSEGGHDPAQHVAAVPQTALYERNTTFHSPDTSYTHLGPYVDPFTTATAAQQHQHQHQHQHQQQQPQSQHYAPPVAREDRKPYVAASPPAPEAQGQFVAPAPAPARSKPKTESPGLPPRAKSPMGHLPYPEDIAAAKAEGQRRPSSVPSSHGVAQLPSPASTPIPLTPVQQTLTFITYPETEPRAYRDGRGGSGVDSDELGDDDDGGSSPSRRGRRGKKQPKKDPFLACFFCRGRKIACHPKNEGSEDRTCTQCAKRHLPCNYPLTSRRGQRKPHDCPDLDGTSMSSPASSTSSGSGSSSSSSNGVSVRASSKSRARGSSKLSTTTSSLVSAA